VAEGANAPAANPGTIQRLIAVAGGFSRTLTPQSLRHLYASVMLVEGGIDITEVARFLGHRDINETYRTYGHLLPNANDKAIAALDAEFGRWSKAAEQE